MCLGYMTAGRSCGAHYSMEMMMQDVNPSADKTPECILIRDPKLSMPNNDAPYGPMTLETVPKELKFTAEQWPFVKGRVAMCVECECWHPTAYFSVTMIIQAIQFKSVAGRSGFDHHLDRRAVQDKPW